jgi:hypothetical protein
VHNLKVSSSSQSGAHVSVPGLLPSSNLSEAAHGNCLDVRLPPFAQCGHLLRQSVSIPIVLAAIANVTLLLDLFVFLISESQSEFLIS